MIREVYLGTNVNSVKSLNAVKNKSKILYMINGGVYLVDHELIFSLETRINKCINNMPDANYQIKFKK